MNVASILKAKGTNVATTRPEATIRTTIKRMKLDGIGSLVVSHDGSNMAGVITERDILYGLATHGAEGLQMRVADFMTREGPTCAPTDSVKDVMATMTHHRVRHVPVVQDGAVCGIVSIGDVVKNRLEEMELEVNVLRDYAASH